MDESIRWVGYVDRATRTTIVGWALDRANPESHVAVEAVGSNGKCVATLANIFRQDVKDAGYGSGHFGFEIDIADWKLSSGSVIVRFVDGGVPITERPIEMDPLASLISGDIHLMYGSMMKLLASQVRRAYETAGDDRTGEP